jgi:hypothetical protein
LEEKKEILAAKNATETRLNQALRDAQTRLSQKETELQQLSASKAAADQ